MNNENRYDAEIPAEIVTQVKDLFQQAAGLIAPFLINLTMDERKSLAKLGDKGYTFVNKGNEYLRLNATPTPPYLDKAAIDTDLKGYDTLRQVLQVISPTIEALQDSMTLAGSEALGGVLTFYNYIKGAAKAGVPGAQPIYEDLSTRFPGRKSKNGDDK